MGTKHTVTLKELHAQTGKIVRGAAQSPVQVTDRGKLVAVITHPANLPVKRKNRRILPAYARFLKETSSTDLLDDLDAIRER
jgi:antitoxin (DNA-binding transcriptional repressor) of toxin-antitoxin stability system